MKITVTTSNNLNEYDGNNNAVEERIFVSMKGFRAIDLQPHVLEAIVKTCMERMTTEEWQGDLTVQHSVGESGGGND